LVKIIIGPRWIIRNPAPEFKQQFSTDGMEEMLPLKIMRQFFVLGKRHLWPCHVPQRDSPVPSHDW
jgi:hypothetical protein